MFWQIHVVESWDKLKGVKNFDTHQEKENGVGFSYKVWFKFKQQSKNHLLNKYLLQKYQVYSTENNKEKNY